MGAPASAAPRVPKTIIPPPAKRIAKTFHEAPVIAPAAAKPPAAPVVATPAPASISPKAVEQKTYSDEEILASVKPETLAPEFGKSKPAPFYAKVAAESFPKKSKVKGERKTPSDQTRLHLNVGEEMGVVPIDVVNSIAGETGLPGKVVGKVDIRERHSFVDVSTEHANAILAKLNRAEIKGHKVKIKAA
jgi:hypothetical protein